PELEPLAADDDLALGALAHRDADGLGGVRGGGGGEEREGEDRAHPGARGSPLPCDHARISQARAFQTSSYGQLHSVSSGSGYTYGSPRKFRKTVSCPRRSTTYSGWSV